MDDAARFREALTMARGKLHAANRPHLASGLRVTLRDFIDEVLSGAEPARAMIVAERAADGAQIRRPNPTWKPRT